MLCFGRGADLVSLSERIDTTSAAGKMVFRMLAVIAEFERDVIAERTSMAMRHLRAQGRHVGGAEPYGFRVKDGHLVPVGFEQDPIELALRLRSNGMSLRLVSQELSRAGYISRTGRPFDVKQVDRMINNRSKARA